jgi:nucleoid-associated protein YgaU
VVQSSDVAPLTRDAGMGFRGTLPAMPGQSDEPVYPPAPKPPADPPPDWSAGKSTETEPLKRRPRTGAEAALPWLLAVLVVLLLASSGGLVTAWIVASMKAAPPPAAAGPTPTIRPSPTVAPTPTGDVTPAPTTQPLHTPTAEPQITPEPEPFVYIVQRGDTLNEIADMFGVDPADIAALNDISNPDRIREDQELLIPGDAPNRPSPAP